MDTTDSFGYWIRRRRKALDLTQEELAARVGCAAVTLRKIEADERRPSRQMAERLAECLGLPTKEITLFLSVAERKRPTDHLKLTGEPGSPASQPGNLPAPVTSLVGRSADLDAILDCMHRKEIRLHTLTGPVGVGKTRLAVEAGWRIRKEFRHGVFLVTLDSIQDPANVPSTTAVALGIHEGTGGNLSQVVADYLANKEILLIFDNFEHLRPAAGFLSSLLAAAPGLCLLVTSRACLHIYGEHEFVVPPLAMPVLDNAPESAEAASVRLFCERAQAVRADFRLTDNNLPSVIQICRRLDGLPLAIELAAARIKIFSPSELLQRLERRLPLLSQEFLDPSRHSQNLLSAIAWSFGLLNPTERRLFERLAVFMGGFNLPAAETVCAFPFNEPVFFTGRTVTMGLPDITDGLCALLDQSLLQRQELNTASGIESRFMMLETIREFALEQLQKDGELDLTQQRHADYFADWAGQAETHLYGPAQADWLARLDRETENLRAALSWLLQVGQFETGSRLAYAQAVFWRRRGRYREGRDWLEKVLVSAAWADLPDDLRAKTLQAAGNMAYRQGDWNAAQQWLGESLKLFRTAGDRGGLARVLFDLGWVAIGQADWAAAKRLNQESLLLAREAGDSLATYRALTNLGWTMLCTSDHKSAASLFSEALESASQVGHTKGVAVSLANLGWIALYQQDARRAAELATQSLCLCNELGEKEVMAECLELLAVAAVNLNEYESAARLSGAAQELWDDLHINRPLTDHYTAAYAAALAVLHQHLPDVRFSVYWKEGKAMTPEAVIALAQAG